MKKLGVEKIRVSGDTPTPRFGHTFTMVSPNKAILFGGAVSLSGKFVITNETYLLDLSTLKWKKLNFLQSIVPSQRAAHAATIISDLQMVIFGGAASGTQGLLKDQLYLLDIRKQPTWKIVEVANKSQTPGQRYGHSMVFSKPYLVVFGGNSGNRAENDVWILNIMKGPFTWLKYQFSNNIVPCPRVYHSAAICEEGSALGMMVIFGGRKQSKRDHNGSQKQLSVSALNDIWGLRKHRDGSWDWVTPPKSASYTPICRYQHLVCFMGSMLVIMGGRSNHPQQAVSLVEIYDTQTSQWRRFNSVSRYRHAIALYEKTQLFVHGGFEPQQASQPLDSMLCIDLSTVYKGVQSQNKQLITTRKQQDNKECKELREMKDSQRNMNKSSRIRTSNLDRSKVERERDLTPSRIINSSKNIRLSNQVVIARGDSTNLQIQKVHMNSLMEQSKRLTSQPEEANINLSGLELIENILGILMPINTNKINTNNIFPLKKDKIIKLCQQAIKVLSNESSLIGIRAPCKIFGSLYGRYNDLIKIFENFGYPDDREMQTYQYVFLGNYVDKGTNSLETLCLLLALKIKYPDHIRLLRGKHQDINLNKICGLGQQCTLRLGDNLSDVGSVFAMFNNVFDVLPLAAAIDDKFLCLSSGIGSIDSLISIKNVERPIKVGQSKVVIDLLWSENNGNEILKYNSKKADDTTVDNFLEQNGLDMIINTKDGLINGIQQNSNILSILSVTNYGQISSKSAILKINKNLSVGPCIIDSYASKKVGWIGQSKALYNQEQKMIRKMIFQKI